MNCNLKLQFKINNLRINSYLKLLISSIWETMKTILEQNKLDMFHFLKILN